MKNEKKNKPEVFERNIKIESGAINEEARTVDLTFSSEEPYERDTWDYGEVMEVLSHNKEDVDMSRLQDGAAVLVNHDSGDQIGVVERAEIGDDKRGRATVRFGKSARAEEIFSDVIDGIRRNISVGYRWLKAVVEPVKDEKPLLRVNWLPMEISFASVPADASIGVGRSDEQAVIPAEEKKKITLILIEE